MSRPESGKAYILNDMNYWRDRFKSLKYQAPPCPDTSEIDYWIDYYRQLVKPVYDLFKDTGVQSVGKVVEMNYNVICKIEAPARYPNKPRNEKYTFVFQNIITGNKSPAIRFTDRDRYGIKNEYMENGGPYPPYQPEINFPTYTVTSHYGNLLHELYEKKNAILSDYRKIVNKDFAEFSQTREDWWVVYNEYLQSNEWNDKRILRMEYDYHECRMCCSNQNLRVHHLSYDNVGDELIGDLITVCLPCHQQEHLNRKVL